MGQPGVQRLRQRDLEQAREAGCKNRQHHDHHRKEKRILELDAPADGIAQRPRRNGDSRQQPHECQDSGCRSQEPGANLSRRAVASLYRRGKLDRKHWQYAGHDIQNQPAAHRQQNDPDQRAG